MPLIDYFKGPEYKVAARRLQMELLDTQEKFRLLLLEQETRNQALEMRQNELLELKEKSQVLIAEQETRNQALETRIKELGLAELWAVQDQIRLEKARLGEIEARIESASGDAEAGRNHLQNIQAQILGAEDIVLLESFALYEPKYPFTNSLEYKQRLAVIREDQKQRPKV